MRTLITAPKSPRHRRWKQGLLCPKAAISGVDGRMEKSKFRRAKNAVCSDHLFLEKDTRKKPVNALVYRLCGGELGIRTLGTFLYTAFRVLHLRPLGQLSMYVIPHFFKKLLERTDGKNNKIFNFRTEENS